MDPDIEMAALYDDLKEVREELDRTLEKLAKETKKRASLSKKKLDVLEMLADAQILDGFVKGVRTLIRQRDQYLRELEWLKKKVADAKPDNH